MTRTTAIYPGSFDPVTNGHLDIIRRASRLFGRLIVAVSRNASKNPTFLPEERVSLLKAALKEAGLTAGLEVDTFDGLLVDYLKRKKAAVVVRGLRFISDFEYEFQMALTNRRLLAGMETVFLMPDEKYTFLSSAIVKEIAQNGRLPAAFAPRCVHQALLKRLRANGK